MNKNVLAFLLPAMWGGIILFVCLMPKNSITEPRWIQVPNADKWVHVFLYFILSGTLYRGYWKKTGKRPERRLMIFAICAVYGFCIECLQNMFTIDRYFEWYDIAANAGGALLGIALSAYLPPKIFFLSSKI